MCNVEQVRKTDKDVKDGALDMTQGNPMGLILKFSIPLMIGNVFQQLYNIVDSIIVGNVVGESALAAVGTCFPVVLMVSALFAGIGNGAGVLIAQYFGARRFQTINRLSGTVYTALVVCALPLSLLGIMLSEPIMHMMNVPEEAMSIATTYLRVVFVGLVGSLGFNINAGILQGFGDSQTSLNFLVIACATNIVLDIILTVYWGMGVTGVALATVLSQFLSWILGFRYLNSAYGFLKIRILSFMFDKQQFAHVIKLAVPFGLQQVLFSIGIISLQSLVNQQGLAFMAGFNGANKIDSFLLMPTQSVAMALVAYSGQNIGANNLDRVKEGLKDSLVISAVLCIGAMVIVMPLSGKLMLLFSRNPEVIEAGQCYLITVLPFYMLMSAYFMMNSVMRGSGDMLMPMISTLIGLWLARIPAAYFLTTHFGPKFMFFSYGFGWFLGLCITGYYYLTGKWKKHICVDWTEKC